MDLALNSDFSVYLDDRNDLATVSGLDEFEQSVVVRVTDYMHESLTGLTDAQNVEEKLRLQVSRVAREHDRIDDVVDVSVQPKPADPETRLVSIQYASDDEALDFEVST